MYKVSAKTELVTWEPIIGMTWQNPRANSVLSNLRHFVSSQILISVFFGSMKLKIVFKKVIYIYIYIYIYI